MDNTDLAFRRKTVFRDVYQTGSEKRAEEEEDVLLLRVSLVAVAVVGILDSERAATAGLGVGWQFECPAESWIADECGRSCHDGIGESRGPSEEAVEA